MVFRDKKIARASHLPTLPCSVIVLFQHEGIPNQSIVESYHSDLSETRRCVYRVIIGVFESHQRLRLPFPSY